jgi:hypothetical protein
MCSGAPMPMIVPMTRPTSSSSRILLVADRRAEQTESPGASVRRYRLARLRFDERPAGPQARFEHLKRVYD